MGREGGVRAIDTIDRLKKRISKNLSAYHTHIKGFSKQDIISIAGRISAMNDAHFYLTEHHIFDKAQAEYLLQFQNPLEIVADKWEKRLSDISDMGFDMDSIFRNRNAEQEGYALAGAGTTKAQKPGIKPEKDGLRKPSILSQLADAKKDAAAQNRQPGKNNTKKAERGER